MYSIFISRTRERQKENGKRTDEINQTNGHSVSNERTKRFKRTYVFQNMGELFQEPQFIQK